MANEIIITAVCIIPPKEQDAIGIETRIFAIPKINNHLWH
jgi:hypothetical protein